MAPIFGYSPEAIVAAQGDVVKFVFMQKNHTVTQSTFDDPCKKMDGGMDSGFKPNPMGMSGPEFEWEMTVPSTDPLCKSANYRHIFQANIYKGFYCKQKTGNHCGIGMVFSINAKTAGEKTMAQFKQLAINKNGTAVPLEPAGIQQVNPGAQAAPSTVTIQAGGGAGAVATATGSAAAGTASVVAGQGTDQQGNACTCHCLCGINSFPAQAAINNFGGFAGSIAAL